MEHKHTFELPIAQIREVLEYAQDAAAVFGIITAGLIGVSTASKLTLLVARRLFR